MGTWRDYVRRVEPYVPGEQPKDSNIIKLNTNENPYGPSPRILNLLKQDAEVASQVSNLRLYPDAEVRMLTEAIAKQYHVGPSQVFVGVGSDDVLAMAFMTFFNSKQPILFPDITYSFYDVWAEMLRIPYETKALDGEFKLVKEDYFGDNGGIVLANPNAPTSIYEPLATIREILKKNRDSIVIVDEAYIDFGGESALSLLPEYDNLLVVRTFSKSRSMAGMRIGYAIAGEELIKAMLDVKYSYNSYTMNSPSILYGTLAMEDTAYFNETVGKIIATREWFTKELRSMGFELPDSGTNFVFAKPPVGVLAEDLFAALKERNIYVRYFNKPRIKDYLRITVGTDAQMKAVLQAMHEIMQV